MTPLNFPYTERSHSLFGTIKRPLMTLCLHSGLFDQWLVLNEVLVDTGADISVVPLPLGQILVDHIEEGQPTHLGGVVSSVMMFNAYVHRVQAKVGAKTFQMPVAIALSETIPPIFGQKDALDRFTVRFIKGQELIIEL